MHKYTFSVVVPIYNAESYLKETIDSVINQTIGFKKNIQLILVNDGSKDKSKEICMKYKEKYPDNIVYVEQENSGVSAARNNGMKYIEGEYVNFLDSDDKWDKNVFKLVKEFFKNNVDIDFVACRMKFFEAREDYHLLDYKFKKTKTINIFEDYNFIHLHITSSFIKSETAKLFKFDENLKYGEDAKYVNEILLEKGKYGVIREALHYYRKRLNQSSAVQNKEKSLDWYTKTIQYFYKYLIKTSKEKYERTIEYVQYLLMYDLQWRIKQELPEFLTQQEKEKYIKDITELLKEIEDYIIGEQKNITSEYKIYALSLKHGRDITKELIYKKGELYFNNVKVNRIRKNKSILKIDILEIINGNLILEGRVTSVLPHQEFEIFIDINAENRIKIDLIEGKKSIYNKNTFAMDEKVLNHYTYKVEIPLENVKKIKFIFKYQNEVENKLLMKFGKFAKLSNNKGSYYQREKYIIKARRKCITVIENNLKNRIKSEIRYIKNLLKENQNEIVFIRLLYYIFKAFKKKDIWIISDRSNEANDNGECFYRYVQKIQTPEIKKYFLIDKKSRDYKEIKKIGKVIKYGTLKHKIYFLLSSKIISSQANDFVLNAFGNKENYISDLKNFKFIFLQHGITKDDLSSWLNKFNKNINLFITATKQEYDSIISGDYYYTENEVKLTGFPRFDRLTDNKEKSIIIMPTQRRKLVEWNPNEKENFSYNPYFKDSECFKFYNDLINDERILEILKQKNYKLKLGLHPLHAKQSIDFKENPYVEILRGKISYSKEFAENALLITDYSSVAFDFAYLKKKVIYTQFDVEEFFEGQVYEKGYFDYETQGFGPVCYDYETTVQAIVDSVKNDCKLEEKYLQRINNFYYRIDNDNSKRVYEEILKM